MRRSTLLAIAVVMAMPAAVFSQTPKTQTAAPPQPQTTAPQTPDAALSPAATPNDAYTYQADGRRDPFMSLIGTGAEPRTAGKRADGVAGLGVGEISVRGVMQSRGTLLAMVQGPDSKTYVVHPGDKLADGIVKAVTPQGLVVIQDINDPLSIQKQREVRKVLRSLEDAKE